MDEFIVLMEEKSGYVRKTLTIEQLREMAKEDIPEGTKHIIYFKSTPAIILEMIKHAGE